MTSEKEAVNVIVGAIKNRKKDVVSFINSHGGSIKKTDSDIRVGQELSKVLRGSKKNIEEFSALIEKGNSFLPVLISGITSMLGSSAQKAQSAQAGSDAITLQLINAGIQKQSATNWPLIISLIIIGIIFIIIGYLIFKKYNK